MNKYSLESHLSKRVVLLNAIILITVTLLINVTVSSWLEHEFDEALEAKANVIVTLMKDTHHGLDFDFADEFMPEFENHDHTEYFQIWLDKNTVFERSHSLKETQDLPFQTLTEPGSIVKDLKLVDGRQGRMIEVVFYPQIPEAKDRTPEKLLTQKLITLVLAREREELDVLISSIQIVSVLATIVILFIISYLVKFTVRKSLLPLHEMQVQIQKLDADNLQARLSIEKTPLELHEVIEQFNNLLARLDESFYREQRFSADVAHELRTPIAELRSMSEVALKWPKDSLLAKEFYSGVLQSSVQMQSLVNNLLALARYEVGAMSLEPVDVEINDVINDSWKHYQQEVKLKQLNLCSDIPEATKIFTCASEFEQIINNLLSNAISYSDEKSEISIVFKRTGDYAQLQITNMTSELEQSDMPLIFDRLWRKSKSRSSSEHSGLGLPLVKAYAELLSLKVKADLSDNKKFMISIENLHIV